MTLKIPDLWLVFIGGGTGALARALLLAAWPSPLFPLPVLVINLVGALALGCLTGYLARREAAPRVRATRLLLGTGLLGGFTTYSTLALGLVQLGQDGRWGSALLYGGASLVGGYLLAVVGLKLGRVWADRGAL